MNLDKYSNQINLSNNAFEISKNTQYAINNSETFLNMNDKLQNLNKINFKEEIKIVDLKNKINDIDITNLKLIESNVILNQYEVDSLTKDENFLSNGLLKKENVDDMKNEVKIKNDTNISNNSNNLDKVFGKKTVNELKRSKNLSINNLHKSRIKIENSNKTNNVFPLKSKKLILDNKNSFKSIY